MSSPQQPVAVGRGDEAGGLPTPHIRPQRGSITSLLILSLIFLMMTNNGGGDGLSARDQYMDSLSSLEWQLGNYSVWLNGSDTSNFTLVSGHHKHSFLFIPLTIYRIAISTTGRIQYRFGGCTPLWRARSPRSILLPQYYWFY